MLGVVEAVVEAVVGIVGRDGYWEQADTRCKGRQGHNATVQVGRVNKSELALAVARIAAEVVRRRHRPLVLLVLNPLPMTYPCR